MRCHSGKGDPKGLDTLAIVVHRRDRNVVTALLQTEGERDLRMHVTERADSREDDFGHISKLPSLFRRGAEALRGGVVVKKNRFFLDYHPVSRSGCHPS